MRISATISKKTKRYIAVRTIYEFNTCHEQSQCLAKETRH